MLQPSSKQSSFFLLTTAVAAAVVGGGVALFLQQQQQKRRRRQEETIRDLQETSAYEQLIGETPLVRLEKLSKLLERNIYVKMEQLNPGQTGKDRAALGMIQQAEAQGLLPPPVTSCLSSLILQKELPLPNNKEEQEEETNDQSLKMFSIIQQAMKRSRSGGLVVEGTSGSTGIALAHLSISRGHACVVVMPDDQASEKQAILKALGAVVFVVPTAAISNPNHYVNIARRLTEQACADYDIPAAFMNQFENQANFQMHYRVTGPELYRQFMTAITTTTSRNNNSNNNKSHHYLDAFVMSAGTGGTIAGIATYLKQQELPDHQNNKTTQTRIVLVDPPGSALYHKIQHGVAFAPQQRERVLQRHRYDTIAEGIGLDRVTENLSLGLSYIDEAVQVSDQEAIDMAHYILQLEGLWVGSSSAMNLVGAVRVALDLSPQANVVTVLCDSGSRHVTRMWNRDFVLEWGLEWPGYDNANGQYRIPACLKGVYQQQQQQQ